MGAGDAPLWSDGTNPELVPLLRLSPVLGFSSRGLPAGPTATSGWETVGRAMGTLCSPPPRCWMLNIQGPSTCSKHGLQRGAGGSKSCHMCWGMNGFSESPGTQ